MEPTSLQPGDLVLVKSHGWVFRLGRRLTGNAYDHVAVVVGDGQTINIDKPRSRLLPAARLLRASFEPLVLRPAWRSPEQRDAFVRWMEQLAGRDYDVRRTLRLLARLVVGRVLRIAWPLERPHADQPRWICTDAVLLGLERVGQERAQLRGLALDWNRLRCGTTNDLVRISTERPDLIARVSGGG